MTVPSYGYPVGNARAFFSLYEKATGYMTGTQSTLANGSTSSAYVCNDVKGTPLPTVQPTDLQIQGGDKIRAVVSWSQPRIAPFDMTVSAIDSALVDLLNGETTNTTNTQMTKFGYNSNRAFPRAVFCAFQQRFVDATAGVDYWLTRVVPKATAMLRPGGATFRGESDASIHITASLSNASYTGQVYGSTGLNFGWEGDLGDSYDIITADPIHFTVFKADGAATTFTTPYRPTSSVVTLNATPNEMVKNGTPTALSSVVTATGVCTLAAAGTAGDTHILSYSTVFVPV